MLGTTPLSRASTQGANPPAPLLAPGERASGRRRPSVEAHGRQRGERLIAERTKREGDCLVWTGSLTPKGYGRIMVDGTRHAAHRFAWSVANGPIPAGAVIDHVCHNRACVEPTHLRLATAAENGWNRRGAHPTNALGLRGIRKVFNRYEVRATCDGVTHRRSAGSLEEAVEIGRALRSSLYGEFEGRA